MPTILLEEIIAILKGWISDFTTYAAGVLDKLGVIKTNTNMLPDIKDNTDDIKSNTAAIITPITTIEGNVTTIKNNTDSIKIDTIIIKNNAHSIATSAGSAAAFAEDIANNTLDIDNRVVTIGSDTTQLRTNSNAMASDLHDIKQSLQYYFLTNIVTEDSEGSIANFDTDLQDYLQKAVVTIPSDANGISGFDIIKCGVNLFNQEMELGGIYSATGLPYASTNRIRSKNYIKVNGGSSIFFYLGLNTARLDVLCCYDENLTFISDIGYNKQNSVITLPNNACYIRFQLAQNYGTTYLNDISINSDSSDHNFNQYNYVYNSISFTSPITDGAEVDLLSGIVKINTSPVTYDSITPIAIRTFKGVNNIYSNIGDISVTYRETLKHYLDKQNS